MALTNNEIIMGECVLRGIVEEVHTYAGWKARGKQVQKGQKALFEASIWKKGKDKEDRETGEIKPGRMFLTKAFFFGASQVG